MEKEFKKILGKKIRTLRELTETTQMDLAAAIGMTSTGAISQVEAGSKGMTVEKIKKTAVFFGVHPATLFSDVEMDASDLKMMRALTDCIAKKSVDPKSARDYELVSALMSKI